ncbi:hypothetical protein DM01DRAFT_1379891 [Hesseltinella vesiculosa]|uniref:DUF7721 domain-containing protein n=1 Tax=Hesseltinella vesiculosa TaxID=101127 RepID=A0A1X2GVH2_9FUNG|nr:hypothetical protein DM01DRAFT_1379891 [Hesseltinella vesiculosa]
MSYGGESQSYQGAVQGGYDANESLRYAQQHHGNEEHNDMFSSVLSKFSGSEEHSRPVEQEDVDHLQDAHSRVYGQGNVEGASSRDLGSAAALQAFKSFTSGGGSSGGSSQLIGMAMSEATKLFQQGGGQGNQSEMLQSAVGMAMKLYASQGSGGSSGGSGGLGAVMGMLGGGGGSAGGAMSLLSKFM